MIETLRQRNFALFWSGQLISRVGDWLLWIALPFYVYEQTGSALATGAMFIVVNIPPLVFGSFAGVFVDRWSHKRTMIVADLLRALIICLLLLTHSAKTMWLLYPLAFTESLVSQFFLPAKSAMLPTLVNQQSLVPANTLTSVSDDVAMLIGPAISGLLYNMVGLTGLVLIDTVSFLLSAWLIALIQVPIDSTQFDKSKSEPRQKAIWTDLWYEWLAGLTVVRQNTTLSVLFIATGLAMIGNGIILVSWAVHIREVLGGGATEYGWVQVAVAIGGILAGFCITTVTKFLSPRQLIAPSGILSGLLLLATFNVHSIPLIFALQLVMGAVYIGFYVPIQSLLQSSVEKEFLGRVFGAYATTNALLILIGQGAASLLGDRVGTTLLLNMAALMALLGSLYAARLPANSTDSSPTNES